MAGFKRSVIINKAIEDVFDFATNLDNASKFLPGVTKIEMLTNGGMKPGAKFKETRNGHSAVIEVVEHKRQAALIAGEDKRSTPILGVLLVAFGLVKVVLSWPYVPIWYHVVFTALLLPMTIIGGKLKTCKVLQRP